MDVTSLEKRRDFHTCCTKGAIAERKKVFGLQKRKLSVVAKTLDLARGERTPDTFEQQQQQQIVTDMMQQRPTDQTYHLATH